MRLRATWESVSTIKLDRPLLIQQVKPILMPHNSAKRAFPCPKNFEKPKSQFSFASLMMLPVAMKLEFGSCAPSVLSLRSLWGGDHPMRQRLLGVAAGDLDARKKNSEAFDLARAKVD